jgi:hypothetical protein
MGKHWNLGFRLSNNIIKGKERQLQSIALTNYFFFLII